MARGDHIRVRRFLYWHHGIDCGDGSVIHYTGTLWKRKEAAVRRTPLEEFADGGKIAIIKYKESANPDEIMERAEKRLAEQKYHLIFNNCEHFATWCMTGNASSGQVRTAATTALVATVAVVGGILVVLARKPSDQAGPEA
jgi:hypothetical protein